MSEDESQLPGQSSARRLLEAMRAVDVQAPPRYPTRITIKGDAQAVEAMLPGVREAFFPKDPVAVGDGRFNTVRWDQTGATLTVELIEMGPR